MQCVRHVTGRPSRRSSTNTKTRKPRKRHGAWRCTCNLLAALAGVLSMRARACRQSLHDVMAARVRALTSETSERYKH